MGASMKAALTRTRCNEAPSVFGERGALTGLNEGSAYVEALQREQRNRLPARLRHSRRPRQRLRGRAATRRPFFQNGAIGRPGLNGRQRLRKGAATTWTTSCLAGRSTGLNEGSAYEEALQPKKPRRGRMGSAFDQASMKAALT